MNVYEKLAYIQAKLKAPKNQYNSFGKYSYRSCEDILEGLKPLLEETKSVVILSDQVKQIGDRYYIEATATLIDTESNEKISISSLAREDETKKGMDLAQVTGSVSSYARKYALNGLFAIDDTKDSDSTNTHGKKEQQGTTSANSVLSQKQIERLYAIAYSKGVTKDTVDKQIWNRFGKKVSELTKEEYEIACNGYKGD